MNNINLTQDDHRWLSTLTAKINSANMADRRHMRALEYFYRAWPRSPSERFPILCMVLDALFGDPKRATQAIIEGVRDTLAIDIPDTRLRLLTRLRASVIHGGAPDVYDSSKYIKYYRKFGADPIREMDLIVTNCLRRLVFDDQLKAHANIDARFLKKAREKGVIGPSEGRGSILDYGPI